MSELKYVIKRVRMRFIRYLRPVGLDFYRPCCSLIWWEGEGTRKWWLGVIEVNIIHIISLGDIGDIDCLCLMQIYFITQQRFSDLLTKHFAHFLHQVFNTIIHFYYTVWTIFIVTPCYQKHTPWKIIYIWNQAQWLNFIIRGITNYFRLFYLKLIQIISDYRESQIIC